MFPLPHNYSQLLAVVHLLFHCPHLEYAGVVPFKDLFKAFRAVKLKLPGGSGFTEPGFFTHGKPKDLR